LRETKGRQGNLVLIKVYRTRHRNFTVIHVSP
jgi:hypothetical protein